MIGCQVPQVVLTSCIQERCSLNAPSLFRARVEAERWKPDMTESFNPTNLHSHRVNVAVSSTVENPVQPIKTGVQTNVEAARQPNKTLCFSPGSSNCTSSRLCLLLQGNWVAPLSRCDSSAAHYSSCCQRKRRQQHHPCSSVVIIKAEHLELHTGKHLRTL